MISSMFFLIFLIFSISVSQSDFDINKFYKYPSNRPFITFDHINNTAYYFNVYNPLVLDDSEILDIKINGSNFSPFGSYDINPLYENIYLDSLLSNEFEHKRGDYGYYENTVLINNKGSNNVSAFLMLHGRTQPRYYTAATKGVSLQNHFFNIQKVYDNKILSKFSTSFMYHNEDIVIPINGIDIIERFTDSYMYGTSCEINFYKFNSKASYASQFIKGINHLNHSIEQLTQWFDFEGEFRYSDLLQFNTQISYKNDDYESNLGDTDNRFIDFILFNRVSYKGMVFDLGFDNIYLNNDSNKWFLDRAQPYLNLSFKLNTYGSIFSITSKNINHINKNENIDLSTSNTLHSLILDYKKDKFLIHIEPFYLDFSNSYSDISGIRFDIKFNNNLVLANSYSTMYFSDSLIPISSYINYSFLIAPQLNNKRFRPFLGFDGIISKINDSNLFDPYIFNYISNINSNESKSVNQLNLKFGFILHRFKISFNYLNFLETSTSFSFDERYSDLNNFFSLEVNWQFLD